MHFVQGTDVQPIAEVHSRAGLGAYRQDAALGRFEKVRGPATNDSYAFAFRHGSSGETAQLELLHRMEAWRRASASENCWRLVLDPASATHVDALTETVAAALDFVAEFGPEALSLRGLKSASVQCEHLAALLPATSTWRDTIPGWHEALKVAETAVAAASLDPQDVLFGMV